MVSKYLVQEGLYSPVFKGLIGILSAYVAYPLAENLEKRKVRFKQRTISNYYKLDFKARVKIAEQQLIDTLMFAKENVPYYQDLFKSIKFDPEILHQDINYLNVIPYMTKEIIREQGERLLSRSLDDYRHHACKTGGSTGVSSMIYYDQEAADFSAAVTLFCRNKIGKTKRKDELHFACRFPDMSIEKGWTKEDWKCFAMNRSNIFFDRLDDVGLDEIWHTLLHRKPYLIHGHPSTIYALACYIERQYGSAKAFNVFEPSGELLEPYMREKIAHVLQCRVINRYGLAEFGVVAYQLEGDQAALQVLDSECWPEEAVPLTGDVTEETELVFTGFRNRLMPLIRYRTGDLASVRKNESGFYLKTLVGRVHDLVKINGVEHATHHIQDILDHRVGGIQEFQIDIRPPLPILRIVSEPKADNTLIAQKIEQFWPKSFELHFVTHNAFVRVGRHAKFRHVVQ